MKEQIFQLRSEGKSYRDIQKILGCSKGTIAYHLGLGQKEKSTTRLKDKRSSIRKYLQHIKSENPCVDCGERYPYWVMDFDHLSDKSFNLGKFTTFSVSLDVLKDEISKCELVCANCHRTRTFHRALRTRNSISIEFDGGQPNG